MFSIYKGRATHSKTAGKLDKLDKLDISIFVSSWIWNASSHSGGTLAHKNINPGHLPRVHNVKLEESDESTNQPI